jgi:flagellar protein FliS
LSKAVAILEEGLRSSLDKEVGGELAENLDALYEYCSNTLIEANLSNQPDKLDEVVKLLAPIRDAWETIGQPGYLQGEVVAAPAAPAPDSPPENRHNPLSYGHV